MYFIDHPGEAISYPIAIPREQTRWQGVTKVSDKKVNPPWRPTADMLAEPPAAAARCRKAVHEPVRRARLSSGASSYRIHGTDAPWTIGTAASKGCIRMYNRDVLDLYPRAQIGAKVTVTWQNFNAPADYSAAPDAPAQPRLREMWHSDLPTGAIGGRWTR